MLIKVQIRNLNHAKPFKSRGKISDLYRVMTRFKLVLGKEAHNLHTYQSSPLPLVGEGAGWG